MAVMWGSPERGQNRKVTAYEKILKAIQKSGMDIYGCVKIYPKAVYYLCLELMESPAADWDCRRMYDLAEKALEMLRSTDRMYYLCEVLEIMERILAVWNERGDMTEEEALRLRPMPAQIREWSRVLTEIFHSQGISEKMENCCYLYRQMYNHRIGDVVRSRRKMFGWTAKALCENICSERLCGDWSTTGAARIWRSWVNCWNAWDCRRNIREKELLQTGMRPWFCMMKP